MTGTEIDDAEAAHADTASAIDVIAGVIRSTMTDYVAHGLHVGNLRLAVSKQKPSNPAHVV